MAIDIKLDKKSVGENTKAYSIFFLGFIILAVLFFVTGNKLYSKISKTLNGSKDLENDILSLQEKIDSLRLLDREIGKNTASLMLAFPDEDPSLFAYSELKELSRQIPVQFESVTFSLGSPSGGEVSSGNIGLDLSGNKEDVLAFISNLTKLAPISGLGAINIGEYAELGGELKVAMSIEVFYSPLPQVLPNDNVVISTLTDEEKEVYKYLTNLKVLVRSELSPAAANDENVDPFFGILDKTSITDETSESEDTSTEEGFVIEE